MSAAKAGHCAHPVCPFATTSGECAAPSARLWNRRPTSMFDSVSEFKLGGR
jgi:hypothetical protein